MTRSLQQHSSHPKQLNWKAKWNCSPRRIRPGVSLTLLSPTPHQPPKKTQRGGILKLSWRNGSQIRATMQWFSLQFYNTWATIENATTSPLPLKPCLYYAALKSQLKDAQYPFLRTITESDPKYKHTSTPCHVSGFTQIWGNCRFSPGTGDPAFKLWAEGDVGQVTNPVQSKAAETEGQSSDKTSDSTLQMLGNTKWMLMLRCVLWTWNRRLLCEMLCLNLFHCLQTAQRKF